MRRDALQEAVRSFGGEESTKHQVGGGETSQGGLEQQQSVMRGESAKNDKCVVYLEARASFRM